MEVYFKFWFLQFTTLCLVLVTGLFNPSLATGPVHSDSTESKTQISPDLFALLLNVSDEITPSEHEVLQQDLNKFVAKLARKQKRSRSQKRFVKHLFYKVHNRYLDNYSQHADFYELLDEGSYDCITGTAFYALVLDALEIDYTIKELPYHVYLMVETEDTEQRLLLESTDPMSGFVSRSETIKERIAAYRQDQLSDLDSHYQYGFEIDEEIDLPKLAGLSYYNEAIEHYNAQNLDQASKFLAKARSHYPGKRMEALQTLIEQVARQQIASSDR